MQRQARLTADGSSTLFVPALDEHYHSTHGALQEALHIFIKHGFAACAETPIRVLEIGFGSGLNTWLTAIEAEKNQRKTSYVSLEKYRLYAEEIAALNFTTLISTTGAEELFTQIHGSVWEEEIAISNYFKLEKRQIDLENFEAKNDFDLIYFDAFAPEKQPNLWTIAIFDKMLSALKPGGFLVTYCAKGQVKRNMKAAGFTIEALPGPPGKREMTKAVKAI